MKEKIDQILQNQVLIMEQMWRGTSYPSIKDDMKKAIEDTKELLGEHDEEDWEK